ncbi:MAG: hypothetical protein RL497_159 [Pseudomonadota bacterium]
MGQYLDAAPDDELLLEELLLEEELLELELLLDLPDELLEEELLLELEELLLELELELLDEEVVPVQALNSSEPNRVRHRADNLGELRMVLSRGLF